MTTLTEHAHLILANGGATWAPGRAAPTEGFMVSLAGTELSIPVDEFTDDSLARFQQEHAGRLAADDRLYFGAWLDGPNVYLDLSLCIPDRAAALRVARAEHQRAVFDLSTGNPLFL
ncbi:hypothetical protein ACIOGZ_08095 [Kitasatospora sp. NPDC088160]|uniref:hypothetical protein n=1 Tax=Kitasatospora sp. NPDC088160 TaxID=3364072 RepID=UPI003808E39E